MTRAAAYARVSTEDQAERQTIETQLVRIREWCETRDIELVAEYTDEGVSGATKFTERDGALSLLDAADAVDLVVVYSADRFGRDTELALTAMSELKRRKVAVDFVVMSFDDTPEGVLQFQVLLAIAQYERSVIARRTKEGRYRKVREGKYMASVTPYGYRRGEDGRLEIDEIEAEVVRNIFAWAQTDGLHVIAARLEETGAQPRTTRSKHFGCAKGCMAEHYKVTPFHSSFLHRILSDERYIGRGSYAGIEMSLPPIVDEELFYRVSEARQGREKFGTSNPRSDLLRGLVKCRRCGGHAVGMTNTLRDGTRIDVYECSRRRRYVAGKEEHAGAQRRFRAVHVDAAVRRWLMDLRRDPEAALTRASLTRERSAKARVEAAAERERAQKELAGLSAEESRAADLAVKGLLSEAQLESQLSRVSARRAELEAILSQQEPDQSLEETVEGVVALRPKDMRQMISMLRERGLAVSQVTERILSDAEALEHWRGQVKDHVRVVWLEDDGRITIEGPLPALTVLPSLHT